MIRVLDDQMIRSGIAESRPHLAHRNQKHSGPSIALRREGRWTGNVGLKCRVEKIGRMDVDVIFLFRERIRVNNLSPESGSIGPSAR